DHVKGPLSFVFLGLMLCLASALATYAWV
ncbi:MAG: hypothetical protein QOG42_1121, partial [Solirubrobacteraceae bacterium]|nr:hypothetical protein [Solirubrobacteraceae bacterium]